MARKKVQIDSDLIVFAEFEFEGKHYKAGDVFVIPSGVAFDEAFTEFRNLDRKEGAKAGLAFSKPGEIIDKETKERDVKRFILPVMAKE